LAQGLPCRGRRITLREPRAADAPALFALLSTDDVSRFISPPPATVEGFERYISWCQRQRAIGQYVCFAIVRRGEDMPIGLIHVRALGPGFGTADWGFALGWNSGALGSSLRRRNSS
jgi:RimJ/RimL family protein N-acetyltransferase